MNERIFAGLNDEQAEAVAGVRGPVCILAGAGSGKTTTITRRVANQIATGAFGPDEILAVTFTEKAAREMGERLKRLGAPAVRAKTFHAEALAQYRKFSTDISEIVASKGQILAPLVARLPMPHKFTSVRDIATEIEWAKNRMITPTQYETAVEKDGHTPPVPAPLMATMYQTYERKKESAGLMDFEDLLTRTVTLLQTDERASSVVRSRYRSITVDEYQDVNLLQQSLLEAWVGDRRDLCVVGDDYQSIFGFTGATARYLLDFPRRYDDAMIVRLVRNYRSTPQVLEVANRLAPRLEGSSKTLRPVLADGPAPIFIQHETGGDEVAWIVQRCRALRDAGTAWEEMAVLYRINGRSEDLEEALSKAKIPYQVKDGSFLRRPAARGVFARLKRAPDAPVPEVLSLIVRQMGYKADVGDDGDDTLEPEEATRQSDLSRIVAMAQEWTTVDESERATHRAAVESDAEDRSRGLTDAATDRRLLHRVAAPTKTRSERFLADLEKRFAVEREGRGVQILTYHRSKGLEFEAVFLPRMEDKELPFALSKSPEDIAEERRLLYVGITRAKRHLFVSYALSRFGERRKNCKPSPFLAEIRAPRTVTDKPGSISIVPGAKATAVRAPVNDEHVALFTALKDWRLQEARDKAVPPYVVFHDQTLARIAEERPKNVIELGRITGIGPAKIARYGTDVLQLVTSHSA